MNYLDDGTGESQERPVRLLTIRDLQELLRCGRTTAYLRVHKSGFPQPVVLSGSGHRWWEHEVMTWLESTRAGAGRPEWATVSRRAHSAVEQPQPAPPRPISIRRSRHDADQAPDPTRPGDESDAWTTPRTAWSSSPHR